MQYAMVRADGAVEKTVTAGDPAIVAANTPAGCEAVPFEGYVQPGAHRYDRDLHQFVAA